MTNKTVTEATKDGTRRVICRHRYGWNLPPEEGHGAYVNGTGAYADCVARWREHGWDVRREPKAEPNLRSLFRFA
jgi:hypothetical protein